MLENICFTYY